MKLLVHFPAIAGRISGAQLTQLEMADDAGSRPFRVFVHPATSLPFDRLTTLEPADVRVLRRIVRRW